MIYKFAILFSIIFILFSKKEQVGRKIFNIVGYCKCSNLNSITFPKVNNYNS